MVWGSGHWGEGGGGAFRLSSSHPKKLGLGGTPNSRSSASQAPHPVLAGIWPAGAMIQPGPPFLEAQVPHILANGLSCGLAMATEEVAVPGCLFLGTCPAPWCVRPPPPPIPHRAGCTPHNTDGKIRVGGPPPGLDPTASQASKVT